MTTRHETDVRVIGFDLGHAETTVAQIENTASDNIEILRFTGASRHQGRVIVSAVRSYSDGEVVVGSQAVERKGGHLYVAFKSPHFKERSVRHPTRLFVSEVANRLPTAGNRPTLWVFGAPSGWTRETVDEYAEVLRSIALPNQKDIAIVPESRAALIHARDSSESVDNDGVRVVPDLSRPILVIDLGSLTTDVTLVSDYSASPIDTGEPLGSGIIDSQIATHFLQHHAYAAEMREITEASSNERGRLLMACRRLKEDFFDELGNQRTLGDVTVVYSAATHQESHAGDYVLRMDGPTIESILSSGIAELGGRTWPDAVRELMIRTLEQTAGAEPGLVLITGGPTAMPFVAELAREVFGSEVVGTALAPSFSTAKGLALAGRTSIRVAAFRKEVDELIAAGDIEQIVDQHYSELASLISRAVVASYVDDHVVPKFRAWRSGGIDTLDHLEKAVAESVASDLRDRTGELGEITTRWLRQVQEALNARTMPICLKWGIAAGALDLRDVPVRDEATHLEVELSDRVSARAGRAAAWAGAVMVAMVSAGMASAGLLGPVGLGAMGLVGAFAALGSSEAATNAIQTRRVPVPLRRLVSEERIVASATSSLPRLAHDIRDTLVEDREEVGGIVSGSIGDALAERAREAELLITQA